MLLPVTLFSKPNPLHNMRAWDIKFIIKLQTVNWAMNFTNTITRLLQNESQILTPKDFPTRQSSNQTTVCLTGAPDPLFKSNIRQILTNKQESKL